MTCAPALQQYMAAFYWMLISCLTVGYGDISAVTAAEQGAVVLAVLVRAARRLLAPPAASPQLHTAHAGKLLRLQHWLACACRWACCSLATPSRA